MGMREVITGAALNGFLAGVIWVVVWMVRRRQPMTAAKLRRQPTPSGELEPPLPLAGDFCRMRSMLSVLEVGVPDVQTVTALMLKWAEERHITLCTAEKKRLKSFGAQQQATISFAAAERMQTLPKEGASALLLGLLYRWTDQTGTLQQSELYNLARKHHRVIDRRLEQFDVQGRHGMRAAGEMLPEKKHRRMGFAEDQRPIYTPRGVREAGALRQYQAWLKRQENLPPEKWCDAALLGCTQGVDKTQLALAQDMALALVNGAAAGKQAEGYIKKGCP